jgi:hypothetical protein
VKTILINRAPSELGIGCKLQSVMTSVDGSINDSRVKSSFVEFVQK